ASQPIRDTHSSDGSGRNSGSLTVDLDRDTHEALRDSSRRQTPSRFQNGAGKAVRRERARATAERAEGEFQLARSALTSEEAEWDVLPVRGDGEVPGVPQYRPGQAAWSGGGLVGREYQVVSDVHRDG